MAFEEVRGALKQRFPMLMVDTVVALEPGKSIHTTKNVTGNELQFLGHFPEHAVMPGTLIVEAIGQSASILFSKTTGAGMEAGEFLVRVQEGGQQPTRIVEAWPLGGQTRRRGESGRTPTPS